MTITDALRIFSAELGDEKIYTIWSSLTSVPMYHQNVFMFKYKLRDAFDIRIPLDAIPISRFTTVGDLLAWCIARSYRTEIKSSIKVKKEELNSQFASLNKPMLNIIITGRSGAGKSSFLNYLIDKELFKTGDGAPVTSCYFEDFSYTSPENGVVYHLLDTKGIEPTTTKECQRQVIDEIHKKDKSNDIYQWIHTVYYCFDASAKRIQPFEVSFIKELVKEASVVILLTKKDLVSETGISELKNQIVKEIGTNIQVIAVCSVAKQTRKGVSARSGREDVLKASFLGLWEKLSKIYPQNQMLFLMKADSNCPLNLGGAVRLRKLLELYKMPESDEKRVQSVADKSFTLLSLDYLCNYPTLYELLCDELYGVDRTDIRFLLACTNNFLSNLTDTLCCLDVESIWAANERMHKQVFSFYHKLNNKEPHVFYSHQSKDALIELKKFGENKIFNEIHECSLGVNQALKEVEDCFFFDSSEKRYARSRYNNYRDKVKQTANELKRLAGNFISAYRSELHQYGQCCLRNDDLENMEQKSGLVFSEADLNANETSYYSTIRDYLKDHKLTTAERSLLDIMRQNLNILPERAGLIEDFVRKN